MKLLKSFLFLAVTSLMLATAVHADPLTVFGLAFGANVAISLMQGGTAGLSLMAMTTTDLATELKAYWKAEPGMPGGWVYNPAVQLNKFTKTITKIKDKYIVSNSVLSHVVQGFVNVWNEMGGIKFKSNTLTAYEQKINFSIKPDEIEGTYLAWANEENKQGKDTSIARYIAQELEKKVIDDIDILSITGEYDENDLGTFGKSMNGIKVLLEDIIAETLAGNSSKPCYLIPIDSITESNAVDQITEFEKAVPTRFRKFYKRIYMGTDKAQMYRIDYENTFGANMNFSDGKMMKTRLNGWDIIGLDNLIGSDLIWCTPDDNFLRLIDLNDMPTIHKIEDIGYEVKIYMRFHLGYGFAYNPMVCIAHTGSELGYENATATAEYLPELVTGSGS